MRIPYSLILASSAFVLTVALTPVVIAFARRIGALDRPGPRRIHQQAVPTIGGLAMVIAVLGVAWAARLLPGPSQVLDLRPLIGLTLGVAARGRLRMVGRPPPRAALGQARRPGGSGGRAVPLRLRRPVHHQPIRRADRLRRAQPAAHDPVDRRRHQRDQRHRRARRPRRGRRADRGGDAVVGGPRARQLLRHVHVVVPDRCDARVPAVQLPARACVHGRHRQPVLRPRARRGRAAREPQGRRRP